MATAIFPAAGGGGAYPDPECPGGLRYSDVSVGDGVSGQCVDSADLTDAGVDETFMLQVSVGGHGSGSVTSNPAGISCTSGGAGTCAAAFPAGTMVELTAIPTVDSFLGWSQGCSGAAGCSVLMSANKSVRALFGVPGEALWFVQVNGSGTDQGNGLATDTDGNIVVVGTFTGTFNLGGISLISAGGSDIYVAKLSAATGTALWAKSFGGASTDTGKAVAVSADDGTSVVVTGTFQGTVNFGGQSIASAGNTDAFVLKLDTNGTHQWSKGIGGSDFETGHAIAARGGAVVVGGSYRGTMPLGATSVTST